MVVEVPEIVAVQPMMDSNAEQTEVKHPADQVGAVRWPKFLSPNLHHCNLPSVRGDRIRTYDLQLVCEPDSASLGVPLDVSSVRSPLATDALAN